MNVNEEKEKNDIPPKMPQRARKKLRKASLVPLVLLTVVCIFVLAAALVFYLRTRQLTEENAELQRRMEEDYILRTEIDTMLTQAEQAGVEAGIAQGREELLEYFHEHMSSGELGPMDTLRSLKPEQIIVGYAGKYLFHDLAEGAARNPFDKTELILDDRDRVIYVGDDPSVEGLFGIDVSAFQGQIDWARVKADGVKFAMIRMGFRGWGKNGSYNDDEFFEQNVNGAYANGIEVGVYWVTHAIDTGEAAEEAEYVLNKIEPFRDKITLPVVLDFESPETAENRIYDLTQEEWTENALVFMERIEAAGYQPMFYGNLTNFVVHMDDTRILKYPIWIAWYSVPLYFPYEFQIWQYSYQGRVDGINGDVDLNIMIRK